MSNVSALSKVQELLGYDIGPELLLALSTISAMEMAKMAEDVISKPLAPHFVPKETEVWPIITQRSHMIRKSNSIVSINSSVEINLWDALVSQENSKHCLSDPVVQTLLYSHGLIMEDPLAISLDFFLSTTPEDQKIGQESVVAAAAAMSEIHSLIDNGIIYTFYTPNDLYPLNDYNALSNGLLSQYADYPSMDSDIWYTFESI